MIGSACCSQVRPIIGVARCVRREYRRRASQVDCEVAVEQIEGVAQLQHRRRVDDVLARRAPMHVFRRFGVGCLDARGELLDERNREIAAERGVACERVGVELIGLAGGFDRGHRRLRNHAVRGRRARERRFHVEHPLQRRTRRPDVVHRLGAAEQIGQTSRSPRAWAQTRSIAIAMPCPTPMHIVQSAKRPPVRCS